MKIKSEWVYLSTIILIAAALLVGNRFDARWAGGNGYQSHQKAVSGEMEWQRGEVISDVEFVQIGESIIWLNTNTEIKFIDGREGHESIQLIQGHIVLRGDIDVSVREVTINATGLLSVVHYSWLDEIDVTFLHNTGTITTPEFTLSATDYIDTIIKMNTLTYEYTESEFILAESATKDFFEAVLD